MNIVFDQNVYLLFHTEGFFCFFHTESFNIEKYFLGLGPTILGNAPIYNTLLSLSG